MRNKTTWSMGMAGRSRGQGGTKVSEQGGKKVTWAGWVSNAWTRLPDNACPCPIPSRLFLSCPRTCCLCVSIVMQLVHTDVSPTCVLCLNTGVCACVCVCLCVCAWRVCVRVCGVCACMCVFLCVCLCLCVCVCLCLYMYLCLCVSVCVLNFMRVCVRVCPPIKFFLSCPVSLACPSPSPASPHISDWVDQPEGLCAPLLWGLSRQIPHSPRPTHPLPTSCPTGPPTAGHPTETRTPTPPK